MKNKKQVYKELNNQWNLFDMTDSETERAYYEVTGLKKTEEQTITNLKQYLLEFIIEQMVRDQDIDNPLADEIKKEVF